MTVSNANSSTRRRSRRRVVIENGDTAREASNVWTTVRFPRLCKLIIILLLIVSSAFLILTSWLVATRSFGKCCGARLNRIWTTIIWVRVLSAGLHACLWFCYVGVVRFGTVSVDLRSKHAIAGPACLH